MDNRPPNAALKKPGPSQPHFLDLMGARQTGHDAANACASTADDAQPGWSELAGEALIDYATHHDRFLTEDLRKWAHGHGLPEPHDRRAWGAIITRACNKRILVRVGWRPAISSRGGAKSLWQSNIYHGGQP